MVKNPLGYVRKKDPKQGSYKGQGFEGFGKMAETTEHRMNFLFDLYEKGIDIGTEKEALLRKYDYIKTIGAKKEDYVEPKEMPNKRALHLIKVEPTVYFPDQKNREYKKFVSIKKEWHPCIENIFSPPSDFVKWIDSINQSFRNRLQYKKFDKYVEQSKEWLAENIDITDFDSEEQRKDFAVNEFRRIQENSLFLLDKYGVFKNTNTQSSFDDKYLSEDAQKILCYLFDCGFSLMIGKGRQIWFTTTMSLLAIKRSNFHKNHFAKYICENLKKGQEILDDKVKYSFYHLPDWTKVSVNNDQEFMLKFVFKSPSTKGSVQGAESKIVVEAPYITAINGGAPDLVMLDEIGQMPLLGKIIQEGRPTIFGFDKIKRIQVPKRQVVAWGTGGEADRGGGEFEKEFEDCMKQWRERKFEYGIIPVYFDCFARPGLTQEMYESEKKMAYDSMDEDKRVKFHQHYPSEGNYRDMFLSSKETLLSHAEINNHKQRIYDFIYHNPHRIQRGYFEPVYDRNKKLIETSFVPFLITGVNWIATDDDDNAPVIIYSHPEPDWLDRYFQGTDPIDTASGSSNFASSIWDSYENTVSACLNTRSTEYRNDYLQAILMNLYYGKCKHLIEINVGKELKNMIDYLGYFRTMVLQAELPKYLQLNTAEIVGINKKAANSPQIVNKLTEVITAYKSNIYIEDFFTQLSTFVRTESKNPSASTGEIKASYRTDNYKYWKDDVIFAITYAYICAQCYAHRVPREANSQEAKKKRQRFVCDESTGWEVATLLR